MNDYLIDARLQAIEDGLMQTKLLTTPDEIYTINGNVIVPAGLEINESGSNLVLSYSDNQLSSAPVVASGYMESVYSSFAGYAGSLFALFASVFVVFFVFRLFKKFI